MRPVSVGSSNGKAKLRTQRSLGVSSSSVGTGSVRGYKGNEVLTWTTPIERKRQLLRRQGSDVLVIKQDEDDEEELTEEVVEIGKLSFLKKHKRKMSAFIFLLCIPSFRSALTVSTFLVMSFIGILFFLFLLPEVLGRGLSWAVSTWGLNREVRINFSGVRLGAWVSLNSGVFSCESEPEMNYVKKNSNEAIQELDQQNSMRSKGKSFQLKKKLSFSPPQPSSYNHTEDVLDEEDDEDENSNADDQASVEPSCPMRKIVWRILRSRVSLEIRIKEFSFGNPLNAAFCRDTFVRGTDIEIIVSTRLCDLLRILDLFQVWSWRPRDQPIRRQPDGGCTQYGIIRDNQTKTWRNNRVLGILDIERFEMCDASIAFEKAGGKLNVNEIGAALARGEVRSAAKRNAIAKRVAESRIFKGLVSGKLSIEVLAARHLDAATAARTASNAHDRSVAMGRRLRQGPTRNTVPSTFVKVTVRGRSKRSKTILRSANPTFGTHLAEFYVSDPSAVCHIAIYEESVFGDALIAQFSTTLKQLILEPERVDGGDQALQDQSILNESTQNSNLLLDKKGFVPLRDNKWRVFHVPDSIEPDRSCDKYEHYEFPSDSSDLSLLASEFADELCDAGTTSKTGSLLDKPPAHGYPAVLVHIRWREAADTHHEDDDKHDSALEQIKVNTAETAARCGNPDAIRAMLASFPYLLNITGGFRIRGTAVCHLQDLFSASKQGFLERRKAKHGGTLLAKDWRAARRKAISLSKIDVFFPNTTDVSAAGTKPDSAHSPLCAVIRKSQHASNHRSKFGGGSDIVSEEKTTILSTTSSTLSDSHDHNPSLAELFASMDGCPIQSGIFAAVLRGSVREVPGLFTIDAALVRLIRGLVGRVASTPGKVSASLGQLAAGIGMGALSSTFFGGLPSWPLSGPGTNKAIGDTSSSIEEHKVSAIVEVENEADDDAERLSSFDSNNRSNTTLVPPIVRRLQRKQSRLRRQVTLALGLGSRQTHKRLDARSMDDVDSEIVCSGYLEKRSWGATSQRWRKYHFELKASTLFYYPNKGNQQFANIVDLRRIIATVDPARKWEDPPDLLGINLTGTFLELFIRLDDGRVGSVCLRQPSDKSETTPLSQWRDAMLDAVLRNRRQARTDILAVVNEYSKSQRATIRREIVNAQQVSKETAIHAAPVPDTRDTKINEWLEENIDEETKLDPGLFPEPRKLVSWTPINGSYTLSRRGAQLDALLIAEASSFGTRVAASATQGLVWINVHDADRVFIYFDDGFMAHRFVGALDVPVKTHFLADKPDSVLCSETCTLTHNGTVLVLSISSMETGQIFYRTEWRLRPNRRNQLEQRTRFTTMHAVPSSSTLFQQRDYDIYSRMSPEDAADLEVIIQ